MRVRRARRGFDLLVGRVEPAVAQVVGDRAGEEHRILQHDRDAFSRSDRTRYCRTSTPSISTRPDGRVVEARNQADQRRLAGAGQADERDHLARLGLEGDVVEHRPCRPDT